MADWPILTGSPYGDLARRPGALERAKAAGIKTLEAKGLSADRSALEIQHVLHAVIFWVAHWLDTNHFPYVPDSAGPGSAITAELPPGTTDWETGPLDVIWRLWLAGEIPNELGEHNVFIKFGPNEVAICTVEVSAHGASLPGRISSAGLTQAETGQTEKADIQARPNFPSAAITLTRFSDNAAIEDAVSAAGVRVDIRTPRIIGPQMYWPPTDETVKRKKNLVESGGAVTFGTIEGPNLLRAWAFPGIG